MLVVEMMIYLKKIELRTLQVKLFVGMILILIFAEALGLYGLIVALILSQNSFVCEGNN